MTQKQTVHITLGLGMSLGEQMFSRRPSNYGHRAVNVLGSNIWLSSRSHFVCVCVWAHLGLCEFVPGAGRPSLGILCFASFH